jgi:hypothetical protein
VGGTAAGLLALYAIMSLNEYIYHRYFQHLGMNKLEFARATRKSFNMDTYRGDGHVEHHRETLDDMTLDLEMRIEKPNEMLDADPWRGTAFPWHATFKMTSAVMIQALIVLPLLGWSLPVVVVTVLAAMLVHAAVWNTLHPDMHGLPDVPLSHGVPSCLPQYRSSELFAWLRMNHEGHHRIDGAEGNYNVCCPLFDQVVGTYVGEIKMKEVVQEVLPKVKEPIAA